MNMPNCHDREGQAFCGVLRIWSILAVLTFLGLPGQAALPDTSLDASLDEFEASGQELFRLCRKLDRPCGEETALGYKSWRNKKSALHLKKTSPRTVLDEISRRHPGHHWAVQDGTLLVEPTKRTYKDLLGRKLTHVLIHDKSSFEAALEVFQQAKIDLVRMGMGNPLYARIDLELKDVTVREALNAIVKADGQVMWSFAPTDADKGIGSFEMGSWRKSGFDTRGKFHQQAIKRNDTFLE